MDIEPTLFKTDNNGLRNRITAHLSELVTEERLKRMKEVLSLRTRRVTVAVEDLYQTQNISAVLRTCECYGVQDVHIIENENEFQVHRAISLGANKWLTLHQYGNKEGNTKNCISQLKEKGYKIVATLPGENSCFLNELPINLPIAFLFGTELKGLSDEAIALADLKVKIPMYGFTESFNISNSVAIILSSFMERLRSSCNNWHLTEEEQEELFLEWLQKSIKKPELLIEKFLSIEKLQK